MKAHIVGGGFGGLAAAAYLVRDAGMSGQDITVYERVTGWAARSRWPAMRRPVAHCSRGATNLGFLGQFAEVPQEVAFTIEYSALTVREAIHRLLRRGPAPPPVYQGRYDPAALFAALKTLV